MLDFRRHSSVRNGRDRQERRRLLVLILMLGIVVVLIGRASDPALWRWFDMVLSPPQDAGASTLIDNRLDAAAQSEGILIKGEGGSGNGKDEGAAKSKKQSTMASVGPRDFEAVRDDTPSTRDEQACSLRLLDVLNKTNPEALSQASLGPVTYAQLFQQPNQYRGRLVSVSGVVHRANRVKLFPNDFGLKEYYQVWLWPSDNPSSPVVVYCLRLPKGFPTGMEFAEEAKVTGFFFKRWAYQAKDVIRTAPMLLAQTLQWQKRPVMAPPEPAETWPISLVVCGAALLAMLAAWYVYVRTRPTRPGLPDQPPNFDVLRNLDEKQD
jgi:hypothetical protein